MNSYEQARRDADYDRYQVEQAQPLLEYLLTHVNNQSRSKIKAILKGKGILVNGKTVSQFDYPLEKGMVVLVSRNKRRNEPFKSRYLRIVYEDQYLIVIEKNIGILSVKAGHRSLNVKTVLDEYFEKSGQNCTAHVVYRLDRDTSGLLVYAKDMNTEQILERNWHDIVYDRRYIAVLSGVMEEDQGTMSSWL
ncbi:MAG: RNA pseudouridine synthase, partial [Prevotella sp.]|nr:RNA pseudouridine synthase [Prevotella sp.]